MENKIKNRPCANRSGPHIRRYAIYTLVGNIVSSSGQPRKRNVSSPLAVIFIPKNERKMMIVKIEKLKSGSYRIRKMYKGVTYSIVTDYKPTQKEAIRLLSEEMDKIRSKKTHITFADAAEEYLDVKKNVISPATERGYRSIINNISSKFKRTLISDITAIDVQKEVNNYSNGRSPKTVSNMHGLISAVIGLYRPDMILNTTLPQAIKKEDYIPTSDDVSRIIKASEGTIYHVPLILSAYGLRRSEICALTPADIDTEKSCIHVSKAKVEDSEGQWHIKTTKTVSGTRDVYIPPEIASLISSQKFIYRGNPNSIIRHLQRTQERLGIPKFSLHKMRHYYASISHSLGIPDSYIMAAGGWKTDNVLKTVYRHALSDKTADMQKVSADYIKNLII